LKLLDIGIIYHKESESCKRKERKELCERERERERKREREKEREIERVFDKSSRRFQSCE